MVAKDGLLIVRRHTPLAASIDCIIVPQTILDGLLTSLHIKLDHLAVENSGATLLLHIGYGRRYTTCLRELPPVCGAEEDPRVCV